MLQVIAKVMCSARYPVLDNYIHCIINVVNNPLMMCLSLNYYNFYNFQIRNLTKERFDLDQALTKKENERRALDVKLKEALKDQQSLKSSIAALEKEISQLQKNDAALNNQVF